MKVLYSLDQTIDMINNSRVNRINNQINLWSLYRTASLMRSECKGKEFLIEFHTFKLNWPSFEWWENLWSILNKVIYVDSICQTPSHTYTQDGLISTTTIDRFSLPILCIDLCDIRFFFLLVLHISGDCLKDSRWISLVLYLFYNNLVLLWLRVWILKKSTFESNSPARRIDR